MRLGETFLVDFGSRSVYNKIEETAARTKTEIFFVLLCADVCFSSVTAAVDTYLR